MWIGINWNKYVVINRIRIPRKFEFNIEDDFDFTMTVIEMKLKQKTKIMIYNNCHNYVCTLLKI